MHRLLFALFFAATPVLGGPIEDARALMDRGEHRQANDLLIRALDDGSAGPATLIVVTENFNRLEDYSRGVEYGKRAIAALPRSSRAHLAYAIAVRTKMQKVSKMKAMFSIGTYKGELRRAIELDPSNVEARTEEIGYLIHAPGIAGGDKDQALKRIEALKPIDRRQAMLMQAELQQQQDNTAGAIATYQEMLERDGEDGQARQGLAFTLQAAGKYHEADRHFAVLLDAEDRVQSMTARYQLARSRILGEYELEQAVDHLENYIAQLAEPLRDVPSKSHAYWRLGLAYQQLRMLEAARRSFQKAISLDGENKQAKNALKKLGSG